MNVETAARAISSSLAAILQSSHRCDLADLLPARAGTLRHPWRDRVRPAFNGVALGRATIPKDILCSVRLLFVMLKVIPAYKRTRQLLDAVVSVLSRKL